MYNHRLSVGGQGGAGNCRHSCWLFL
jgi:hypothetical protein